ncbi:MAG TPA: phosphoribosylanthranilate isomerase [Steroidobacter sp.]|jgi:phosphoribosylanthranilate isomerase|nr:phosphoribosylanthranilate isomerase [Steroidobacteraceae bacterium]HLS81031.1 phosphoribosylanthranilate isomerase [Steroidobacter sp.]
MSLWIKICGLTTPEGVQAAVDAGVDAIGFVFASSRRQVSARRALDLARCAPSHTARVAVMLHPPQSLLDEVWSVFRPDVLQTDIEDLASLEIPQGLQVTPVVRASMSEPPPRLLFEGPVSGVGETADWRVAAQLARATQLVLAGGLNAANVADAIAAVRPFGVDVSSGVECAPGIKDPRKIHDFVRNARAGANQ